MHLKKSFLIILQLFVCSLLVVNAQTFDLGCQTQDDADLGMDRKDWNGGNTDTHSDGAALNFTLPPSDDFADCKKITEFSVEVTINDIDISGVPTGCTPGVYYLNFYLDSSLPFGPASIPTSALLIEESDPDFNGLSGTYTFTCDVQDIPFDYEVGVDLVPVISPFCPQFQELVSDGTIIMDYQVCITGIVGDAGDPPDAVANAVDTEVCIGQDIGLFESGNDGDTYDWSGPNGYSSTAQNPVILTSDANDIGIYTVLVTDADGCTNTDEVEITAAPIPAATADATSTAVCPGNDIELLETGNDATIWSWTGPDGFTDNIQNPVISPSTSASLGTYFVTVTDAGGCTNTSEVEIMSSPLPTATADAVSTNICPGQDIELLETGGDGASWEWEGPDGFTSSDNNPSITGASNMNIGTYIVTVTDAGGCTNTSSVDINAGAAPNTNATAILFDVCTGQEINLIEDGGDAVSWLWSGPGGYSSTDQNPMLINNGGQIGSYTVVVTDANGCTGSDQLIISQADSPDGCISGNGEVCESQCDGQQYSFDLSPSSGDFEIELSFPGTAIPNFVITGITDGQTFGICSDPFNGLAEFDGTNLILPTGSLSDGTSVFIQIAGLTDLNNPGCAGIPDPNCEIEIEFTEALDLLIEFDGVTLMDGAEMNCITGFDPVTDVTGVSGTWTIDGDVVAIPVDLTAYPPGNHTVAFTPDADECAFETEVIIEVLPCANCAITDALIADITCNSNLTDTDETDDYISFTLDPQVIFGGGSYSVMVSSGTINPTMGTYGGPTTFELQDGSAGAGDIIITIQDLDDANCFTSLTLSDPGSCSGGCNLTSADILLVTCGSSGTLSDPNDDTIVFQIDVEGDNTGTEYSIDTPFGAFTGEYGVIEDVSLPMGSAGGGDITLTITDANDSSCSIDVILMDPGTCSDECLLEPIVANVLGCNDNGSSNDTNDDFLTFELDPQGLNFSGEYTITSNTGVTPTTGTFGGPTTFTSPSILPTGGLIMITITSVDDPSCTQMFNIIDAGPCSSGCPDPGTCDDGDCSNGEEIWDGGICECIAINIPDPTSCVDDGDCSNGEEVWDDTTCACTSINIPDPSTCIEDGDCTNGIDTWNDLTCECESVPSVLGCTNPTADNYDPTATCDDGSCEFDCADPGNCDDGVCSNGEEVWDGANCECTSINIPDPDSCIDDGDCSNGEEIWNDNTCMCEQTNVPDPDSCVDDGDCNNGEEIWDDNTCMCEQINVPDPSSCQDDGDCTNGIEVWNDITCDCEIELQEQGCTDPNADNYNPNAVCDDGSCEYDCPDPGDCDNGDCSDGEEVWDGSICDCTSINIPDPDACMDDGDCTNGIEIWNDTTCDCIIEIQVQGCTDPMATNYDPAAVCDDGSCEYDCPDPGNCDNGICSDGEEVWNSADCACESINVPVPCVDDGDCSNGEEVWDESTCDCLTENFVDPATCVDDGDCNNGIEYWNDETCECLTEEPLDCSNGGGVEMPCDDNDPCTINDVMIMLDCDGTICEPCAGQALDCADENNTTSIPCDDGSEFTSNDVEIIFTCDGTVCQPCEGILDAPKIFFPTVFSPDGDGDNDKWGLFTNQEFLIKEFIIYDRWGEILYQINDVMNTDDTHRWDGRYKGVVVNPGVYIYYVDLGEPFNEVKVGDLTLVH